MSAPRKSAFWIALSLFLLTSAVYSPSIRFGFVNFDDPHYVTGNDFVRTGLTAENIKRAFSGAHSGNWHPLTWISHMIDCELFGLNAGAHHAINFLIHSANAALLFFLLHRLTSALWRSAFVAAFFALHPIHVESVAWISERKDVLSTFFGLLALWFYIIYAQRRTARFQSDAPQKPLLGFYLLALLFFTFSLLSKAMLVTLPFVLLLLDFWPLKRVFSVQYSVFTGKKNKAPAQHRILNTEHFPSLFREKLPFVALTILFCVITFLTQKEEGAVRSVSEYSLPFRFGNAFVSYLRYLGKTFWPTDLAAFYPMETWAIWQITGAVIVLLGISLLAIRFAKNFPALCVGWFWFLGTLVPVIGFVQVSEQALADRYSYVPLVGIFIALVWLVTERGQPCPQVSLPDQRVDKSTRHPMQLSNLFVALGIASVLACTFLTTKQLQHWRNTETLFRHAIAVTDKNYLALNHLSTELMAQNQMQEAEKYLTEAVKIHPNFFQAHLNLGNILANQGRLPEAEIHFHEAAKISPDSADAHYNLANALRAQGKIAEAAAAFVKVLELDTNYADAHAGLAFLFAGQGRMPEAARHYAEVTRLRPESADAQYNFATALLNLNQLNEAKARYEIALNLRPDFPQARFRLGHVFKQMGDKSNAIIHFTEALRLQPDFPEARRELESP